MALEGQVLFGGKATLKIVEEIINNYCFMERNRNNYQDTINNFMEIINREEPILRSLSEDETKLQNYWLDYEGNRITLRDMIIGYTGHLICISNRYTN